MSENNTTVATPEGTANQQKATERADELQAQSILAFAQKPSYPSVSDDRSIDAFLKSRMSQAV